MQPTSAVGVSDDAAVLADATELANPEEALNPRARRPLTPATSVALKQDPGQALGVALVAAATEEQASRPAVCRSGTLTTLGLTNFLLLLLLLLYYYY